MLPLHSTLEQLGSDRREEGLLFTSEFFLLPEASAAFICSLTIEISPRTTAFPDKFLFPTSNLHNGARGPLSGGKGSSNRSGTG